MNHNISEAGEYLLSAVQDKEISQRRRSITYLTMTDLNIARSSSLLDTANRALKACDVADSRIMYHMIAIGLRSTLLS